MKITRIWNRVNGKAIARDYSFTRSAHLRFLVIICVGVALSYSNACVLFGRQLFNKAGNARIT